MSKRLGIIAILVFAMSFTGLVFAQNSNSSTTGDTMSASNGNSMGRKRRRRVRRHMRRRVRRHGAKMATNANSGNANR